jgi:predicted permease
MWWRKRKEMLRQLEQDILTHIEQETRDNIERGMSPDEARTAALRKFGNVQQIKEQTREVWTVIAWEQFLQDVRYGFRLLRRHPGFAAAAILTLALGIGANTAIFSLINAVLLRALPVRDPGCLVEVARFWAGQRRGTLSYPLYSFLRDQSHSFAGMLAQSTPAKHEINISGAPETVETQMVSGSYYQVLGVTTAAGHTFTPEYDRELGGSPVAVISYQYWQRRFELDASVIGKTFQLHQTVFTIIGVTPKEFFGTMPGHDPDVTFPLFMDAQVNAELNKGKSWLADPQINWLSVIGRLKDGVNRPEAEAEARVLFQARNHADAGQTKDAREQKAILAQELFLEPAAAGLDLLRVQFSKPLTFLMCMVGLVLLLACVNLSSLLVGRTFARLREITVRMAVGAGRGRLVRQFLAESLGLACTGGVIGLALAPWFCRFLVTFMSNGEELFLPVSPDGHVLAFTGTVSLGTSLVVGLAPALYATRLNLSPGLKQVRTGGRQRLAQYLLTAQIAISLLLLVGAGLFVRTLINLRTLDAGFRPDGVLVFGINSEQAGYKGERLRHLQATMLDRLQTLPGIRSASLSLVRVLSGGSWNGTVEVEGYTDRQEENNQANFNEVGPQYFQTMGTPVLLGREFTERDLPGSPKVVVVNEAFVRHYFGHASPLGKHVKHMESAVIVGVVKDVKYQNLREASPGTLYFPALQDTSPQSWSSYLVRVPAGEALSIVNSVRQTIRQIDPVLQMTEPTTLVEVVNKSLLNERILATLSAFFGAIALLLACVGVFGVMASYVARRTNEFGIRLALGAQRQDVFRTVWSEVAIVLAAGMVIGLVAAISVTRVARSLLFGLKPTDPFTFALAVLILAAVSFLAGSVPARRAAQVDPTEALRAE